MESLKIQERINDSGNFITKDFFKTIINFNLVKHHVRLYTDMLLRYTKLFVAHGRILSVFDTTAKKG